jgi:hypothetical protein
MPAISVPGRRDSGTGPPTSVVVRRRRPIVQAIQIGETVQLWTQPSLGFDVAPAGRHFAQRAQPDWRLPWLTTRAKPSTLTGNASTPAEPTSYATGLKFGVDGVIVRTAVVQVGNMAADVERYLNAKVWRRRGNSSHGGRAGREYGSRRRALSQ